MTDPTDPAFPIVPVVFAAVAVAWLLWVVVVAVTGGNRARAAGSLVWFAVAAPGLYQIALLGIAVAGRLHYPYDLEWMEGGMLHHALRIANGEGIYVAPSIDFIPYLYTPLYPSLLALFGSAFGLTYTLGRMISAISLAGLGLLAFLSFASGRHQHASRGPALAGAALGLGIFAAIYPFVEGWFDLVRADTMFLFMITAGIAGLSQWSLDGRGLVGHGKVAAGAAILALAFFCKQTGIIYVAFGGVLVVVLAWRRIFSYVAMAGAIGLGGTWALNHASDGWFWIYVSKIHRAHDFNMDRFWKSFGLILWHFPAMTIVIGIGLIVTAVTWVLQPNLDAPSLVPTSARESRLWPRSVTGVVVHLVVGVSRWIARTRHRFPTPAQPLVLWSAAFAVSTVVGAVGWGTEFAHFNAYMPAFLHGGFAAGAAVPAVAGCVRIVCTHRGASERAAAIAGTLGALLIALPLGITLMRARWVPAHYIPSSADVAAGDKLIARIRAIDGDVWLPSHPWYAELAGKTPHVHRMGIKDVTARQPRVVTGLDDSIVSHRFAAIVLDDRDVHVDGQPELQAFRQELHADYRPAIKLPADERPRVFTGAQVVPETIWMPTIPAVPPADARVLFAFEDPTWAGWTATGGAWGPGPVTEAPTGVPVVYGVTGKRFATSSHGGDAATGRVTSAPFTIDGTKITMMLGGGTDATKLRVELWVDGTIARTASVPLPGGDTVQPVSWDVAELGGKSATLVLVDDATAPGGHLDIDDVWLWHR